MVLHGVEKTRNNQFYFIYLFFIASSEQLTPSQTPYRTCTQNLVESKLRCLLDRLVSLTRLPVSWMQDHFFIVYKHIQVPGTEAVRDLIGSQLIFIYFLFIYLFLVVLPYIVMNQPWVYMCSPSWTPSHLPPHPITQGHPSAPALSTLSHASNLDWRSISYIIIYMFQCNSLKYPTLAFSHRVQKTVLYICVSFSVSHTGEITNFKIYLAPTIL